MEQLAAPSSEYAFTLVNPPCRQPPSAGAAPKLQRDCGSLQDAILEVVGHSANLQERLMRAGCSDYSLVR